ncbi:hypothetical protein FORC81_p417 (plasmid) [Escherichia coli]|nr:hypothetical protein FORC81_p417 [Escherichia coli]
MRKRTLWQHHPVPARNYQILMPKYLSDSVMGTVHACYQEDA